MENIVRNDTEMEISGKADHRTLVAHLSQTSSECRPFSSEKEKKKKRSKVTHHNTNTG